MFQLSSTASFGGQAPGTLHMAGYILGYSVTVLVDTGSSHNILRPRLASFLQLPVSPFPAFPVMEGNGDYIKCLGVCKMLP